MEKRYKTIYITSIPSLDTLMHTKLDTSLYVSYGEHVFETNFTWKTIEPNKLFLLNLGVRPSNSGKLYAGLDYSDTKKIRPDKYNEILTASKKILCLRIECAMIDQWNYSAAIYFNNELSERLSSGKRNVITFHDDDGASYYLFLDELESAEDFLKQKHKIKVANYKKQTTKKKIFEAIFEKSVEAKLQELGIKRRKNDGAFWINFRSILEDKIKRAIEDTVKNELCDILTAFDGHIKFNLNGWSLGRKLGNITFDLNKLDKEE